MMRRGIGSTLLLTMVYWVSDVIVALWMGGLLIASRLFRLPLDLLPEGADIQSTYNGATTAIGMIDKLRPFVASAIVVLIASVILSVMIERQGRHSIGWWVMWLARSTAAVAMVGVALYAFGSIDARIVALEREIALLRTPPPKAVFQNGGDGKPSGAPAQQSSLAGDERSTARVLSAFDALEDVFGFWMWVQVGLGSIVLLSAAIKQAVWRRSWVDEHELARRAKEMEKELSSYNQSTGHANPAPGTHEKTDRRQ